MPRGIYNRKGGKRKYTKHHAVDDNKLIDSPRLIYIAGRDVLVWNDRFFIEVYPKAWQIKGDEEDAEPEQERAPQDTRSRKAGMPMSQRTCGNCGRKGHRRDSCPNELDNNNEAEGDERFLEVTRDQVQELKDEGLTSLQVAARLKCRIAEVNKHW
jgi:hypothetical protein